MEYVFIAILLPFALAIALQFDRRLKRVEAALKLEPETLELPSRQRQTPLVILVVLLALGCLWVLWY